MSTEPTPGPWNIEYVEGSENVFRLWDADDNYVKDIDEEACLANARLMSAAPDLLEALEELLNWSDPLLLMHSSNEEIRNKARAAMLKARGGV